MIDDIPCHAVPLHDTLNALFRHRPQFAVEMLRDRLDLDLPGGLPVQLVGNELNDRPSTDLYPDTVITVGAQHDPLHAIIVEVQQREDSGKQRTRAAGRSRCATL
ncbi:hypothetical protein AAH991_09230 [Microbispora sp. ZYX-F-249]|uniref:Rpn family recombination-promoting nuclease/putative transposase n=1 Tax=Microbispora maris TaxID=3144104 RepID=A0ABV0AL50_9ACTN